MDAQAGNCIYRHIRSDMRPMDLCGMGGAMIGHELLGLFGIGFALLGIIIFVVLEVFDG